MQRQDGERRRYPSAPVHGTAVPATGYPADNLESIAQEQRISY